MWSIEADRKGVAGKNKKSLKPKFEGLAVYCEKLLELDAQLSNGYTIGAVFSADWASG